MSKDFTLKSKLKSYTHGGHIAGPGGPTDDKIPALLSDGEYVLPADTVRAIGRENLDRLRAMTHKPVKGEKGMADGGDVEDFWRRQGSGVMQSAPPGDEAVARRWQELRPGQAPAAPPAAPQPPPADVTERGAQRFLSQRAPQVQAAVTAADAAAAGPSPVVQAAQTAQTRAGQVVNAGKGALRTAAGWAANTGKSAGNALLRAGAPIAAVYGAADGAGTDTSDYEKRLGGLEKYHPLSLGADVLQGAGLDENKAQFIRDIGTRASGVGTDIVNALSLGTADDFFADKQRPSVEVASDVAPAQPAPAAPPEGFAARPGLSGVYERTTQGAPTNYSADPRERAVQEQLGFQPSSGKLREFTDGKEFAGPMVVDYRGGTQALERANAITASANAANRGADLSGGGPGAELVDDQSGAINKRYDAAAQKIANAYSGRGLRNFRGRSARYQADLEQDRGRELTALRGDQTNRRGQNMSLALGGAKLAQDAQQFGVTAQLKLREMANAQSKYDDESFQKAWDGMHQKYDKDGMPYTDTVQQERHKDFVLRSDPTFAGLSKDQAERKFEQLSVPEKAKVLSASKIDFAINEDIDASQQRNMFFGKTGGNQADPIIGDKKELTLGDYTKGVPMSDIFWSSEPFGIVEDDAHTLRSGRVVRADRVNRGDLGREEAVKRQRKLRE